MRILLICLFPLLLWAQSDASIEKAVLAANAQVTQAAESRDAARLFSFMVDTTKGSIVQDGVLSMTPAEATTVWVLRDGAESIGPPSSRARRPSA